MVLSLPRQRSAEEKHRRSTKPRVEILIDASLILGWKVTLNSSAQIVVLINKKTHEDK